MRFFGFAWQSSSVFVNGSKDPLLEYYIRKETVLPNCSPALEAEDKTSSLDCKLSY